MPAIHVDASQLSTESVSTEDADGTEIEDEFVIIPVLIPTADVAAWGALYTATDAASPIEADARVIARCVLDALAVATA